MLIRILAVVIAAVLALALLWPVAASIAYGAPPPQTITVLYTHDLHDRLLPAAQTDGAGSYGGFARLKTLLDSRRTTAETSITVDAGDFSMGSLFQTIYTTDAPELRMLGALGYDAVTLGNHEYDYGSDGLAAMLTAAADSGDTLPQIVQANYTTPLEQAGDPVLAAALDKAAVKPYTMIERGGLRIALFGLMGTDADDCAPTSGMTLDDPVVAAQSVVAEILTKEEPDLIVCLSHSGTDAENEKNSEDELLAKSVPEIDLIVSGHTHTTLEEPLRVNDTWIVSCGEYCQNLGAVTLRRDGTRWTAESNELFAVDDSVAEDPVAAEQIEDFKALVQSRYLDAYGWTFNQVLAENPISFPSIATVTESHEQTNLGDLLTDSYGYAVARSEKGTGDPVTMSVVPAGVIRASFAPGEITLSDAFDVFPLGRGIDGTVGNPLVSIYLTGKELSAVAEIDASLSEIREAAILNSSGVTYTYNPNRMIMDRVTDLRLTGGDAAIAWPDDKKLYRVVTDLYSAQMLGSVQSQAYGLIRLTPKDAQGQEITDFSAAVLHDENGRELKAWVALADYLSSFPEGDAGVSVVPDTYAASQNRKVIDNDDSVGAMLQDPGLTTGIGLVLLGVVLVALFFLTQHVIRRRNHKHYPDDEIDHL